MLTGHRDKTEELLDSVSIRERNTQNQQQDRDGFGSRRVDAYGTDIDQSTGWKKDWLRNISIITQLKSWWDLIFSIFIFLTLLVAKCIWTMPTIISCNAAGI